MPIPDYRSTDTCARCGLPRRTHELEAEGVIIRLCDECYWGREFAEQPADTQKPAEKNPPAA